MRVDDSVIIQLVIHIVRINNVVVIVIHHRQRLWHIALH